MTIAILYWLLTGIEIAHVARRVQSFPGTRPSQALWGNRGRGSLLPSVGHGAGKMALRRALQCLA